jgi:hypothetical protein
VGAAQQKPAVIRDSLAATELVKAPPSQQATTLSWLPVYLFLSVGLFRSLAVLPEIARAAVGRPVPVQATGRRALWARRVTV